MSHAYFNELWSEAQADLRRSIVDERKLGTGVEIPSGDRSNFFSQLAHIYYKWIFMYKKFDESYDQIVHPQKLPLIRKLLDLVISRLVELRNVMVGTELSEVLYFDDVLHFYSWMPSELDVPTPKYYIHEKDPSFKERVEIIGKIRQNNEDEKRAKDEELEEKREHDLAVKEFRKKLKAYERACEIFQPYEAVAIFQIFERHRQGLDRYAQAKYMAMEEQNYKKRKMRAKEVLKYTEDEAATIIQKLIRGYLARRHVQKIREKELRYLGMMWGPRVPDEKGPIEESIAEMEEEIEKNAESRRRVRRRYEKNFHEAEELIESRLRLLEAPEMAERMKWQLRTWMLRVKEKDGKLPEIPKAGLGGSVQLFCPDKLPPEILEKIKEAEGGKKKKKKKEKAKKKKDKKKKDKKKKKKEIVPSKLEPIANMEELLKGNKTYNMEWRHKDESGNPDQKHEDDIIFNIKRKLVGQETRNKVDVLMRAELKVLKKALEKKKGKGKKGKGKGKKGKGKSKSKGKKGKKGKGKRKGKKKGKKKKFKDLTPDRTWQSLFEELVKEGIIVDVPKTTFKDLIGEYSLVNETIRKYFEENPLAFREDTQFKMPFNANPPPTYGDVKRAIRDICILPLGSPTVHELVNFTKSLLIAGPAGSGKKSLVYALCNELGATLFDLTATNIAGKYPGKSGLTMLIHLMNKVGRLCAPTIFMIDKVEKVFAKKVPKTDKTEPKRLKKQLKKFLKLIGPEDQMMLIGITSEPWAAKMKPLKKTFEKFLYIPKSDHGSRMEMWRKEISENLEELHPNFDLSLLTKLSDSWTLGDIKKCSTLAIKRHHEIIAKDKKERDEPFEISTQHILSGDHLFKTIKVGKKRLRVEDFIDRLSEIDPVFLEQEKAWNSWFNKTPLQKLRLASQHPSGKASYRRREKITSKPKIL